MKAHAPWVVRAAAQAFAQRRDAGAVVAIASLSRVCRVEARDRFGTVLADSESLAVHFGVSYALSEQVQLSAQVDDTEEVTRLSLGSFEFKDRWETTDALLS